MRKNALQSLLAQKSWANKELFEILTKVNPVEQAESLIAVIRTLNHIHVVDQIFRAHLVGALHGYEATNTVATPALNELHAAVEETDTWFENYAASVSDAQLHERISFDFTDGDAGAMTRQEMLLHVITHGCYHRGNVGQVLKSMAIAPPRDLYTKFLHLQEPSRRQA